MTASSCMAMAVMLVLLVASVTMAVAVAPIKVRVQHHPVEYTNDIVVDTHTPHFTWQLMDEMDRLTNLPKRGVNQVAYQLIVKQKDGDLFVDTGRVASSQSTQIVYNGPKLTSNTRYEYSIRYWSSTGAVSEEFVGNFRTAFMNANAEFMGDWIGSMDIAMNQVRKEFMVSQNFKSATIFMSGIGYSNLYINGMKVDPSRRLDPGWSTYERRTLYVTFDLTSILMGGMTNAIGIELGNGWYSQEQYWDGTQEPAYGPPRVKAVIIIQNSDGSETQIMTDESWVGRTGHILHDGVYFGTITDARLMREGWSTVGFTDKFSLWVNASTLSDPVGNGGVLSLQNMAPIRIGSQALHIATSASVTGGKGQPDYIQGGSLMDGGILKPVSVGGTGHPVVDLGQNFAGWCQFNMSGHRGLPVMFRYAEILQQPYANGVTFGDVYTDNLRHAAASDIYIFAKENVMETFETDFTVHGFRYVSIMGYYINQDDVQCFQAHSETTLVGNFTSSSPVVNQIQHNVQWGQLSNSMSLPSDCPQRDERKGWMGDAGLTVDETLYNFDYANFYINFLDLIHDIQGDDGSVTDTVPLTFGGRPADPNWGTAFPTIVWQLYQHYGDKTVLSNHFDNIYRYVEYVRGRYNSGGLKNMFHSYGDWVPPPPYGQTNINLISSFPFLRDVYTLINISTILGNTSVAKDYTSLYSTLATEWHSTWYNSSSGGYADNMQTANALSLALPMVVPDKLKSTVLNSLVTDLQSKMHVTTGIVGIAQLYPILSTNGFQDLAMQLITEISYPSYGYMFNNPWENATTVWEVWDAPTRSDGPSMNSRNHHMFSSIGAWFYKYLAGVELNGLEEIQIFPRLTKDMSLLPNVSAEVHTIKGPVLVDWKREEDGLTVTYKITVPHNTKALITFDPVTPSARLSELSEGGTSLWKSVYHISSGADSENLALMNSVSGVNFVRMDQNTGLVSASVSGGSYEWSVVWA